MKQLGFNSPAGAAAAAAAGAAAAAAAGAAATAPPEGTEASFLLPSAMTSSIFFPFNADKTAFVFSASASAPTEAKNSI